jgi:hypothetical protein
MDAKGFLKKFFYKDTLQDIAIDYGLSDSGTKDQIIDRILDNVDLEDILDEYLYKDDLKDICYDLGLPVSGTKWELITSIVEKIEESSEEIEGTSRSKRISQEVIIPRKNVSAVIQAIKDWIPRKRYASEEGYRADLAAYLDGKGFKTRMDAGETKADILVNSSIPIELKKNPRQTAYDRLVGQATRNVRAYGLIIIVICDITRGEMFEDFMHIISSRFSQSEVIVIKKSKD